MLEQMTITTPVHRALHKNFDDYIMNNDIVNTTLVAAYVGKGNGEFVSVTNGDKFQAYPMNSKVTQGEGAYAIGAKQGWIYVREEYPLAVENVTLAIEKARELFHDVKHSVEYLNKYEKMMLGE